MDCQQGIRKLIDEGFRAFQDYHIMFLAVNAEFCCEPGHRAAACDYHLCRGVSGQSR